MTTTESTTLTISFTDSEPEEVTAAYYQIEQGWITFKTDEGKAIATYPSGRVASIKTVLPGTSALLEQLNIAQRKWGKAVRNHRLKIASAEEQALALEAKGEKWGAHAIVSLLAIIEDLTKEPAKPSYSPDFTRNAARLQKSILESLGRPVPDEILKAADESRVD